MAAARARSAPTLSRGSFLRLIPLHLLLAALFGAATAVILSLLNGIQLSGRWNYVMIFPLASIYVNGVIMPAVIPGRHFSFGFLCAMMLILICMASMILSTWIPLPHSMVGDVYVAAINTITFLMLATGASLGLFYGILVGRKNAILFGGILGAIGGYVIGLASMALVSHDEATRNQFIRNSMLDLAWQGALAGLVLHLFAAAGAFLGASDTVELPVAKAPVKKA
jgi:hypothetical protein